MKIISFIFVESYIFTLILHFAHRNTVLSSHTLWVSIPGSIIIFLSGGIVALVVYYFNKIMGHKNRLPFIVWGITIAVIGLVLIYGAKFIPIGFEYYKA